VAGPAGSRSNRQSQAHDTDSRCAPRSARLSLTFSSTACCSPHVMASARNPPQSGESPTPPVTGRRFFHSSSNYRFTPLLVPRAPAAHGPGGVRPRALSSNPCTRSSQRLTASARRVSAAAYACASLSCTRRAELPAPTPSIPFRDSCCSSALGAPRLRGSETRHPPACPCLVPLPGRPTRTNPTHLSAPPWPRRV
jgi:hypothetical protein